MADQKIQVEISGDSSTLMGALKKGLEGLQGFSEGVKAKFKDASEGSSQFTGEIGKLENKVKDLREELVKLKAAEMAGGPNSTLSTQIKATGQALSNAQRDLQLFRTHAGGTAQEVNHLENAMAGVNTIAPELGEGLESLGGRFGALGGIGGGPIGLVIAGVVALGAAAVVGVGALVELADKAAAHANETGKAAQKIGLTTDAYSELIYVADQADVAQESFLTGMAKFSKGLYEAIAIPSSQAAMALKRLGLEGPALTDALRDPGAALETIAGRLSEVKSAGEKAALAQEIFGRGGKDMLPLLNEGAEGIRKLREEAHTFGVVVSKEDAEAAAKFEENSKKLKSVWEGLEYQLGKAALPALGDLSEALVNLAKVAMPYIIEGAQLMGIALNHWVTQLEEEVVSTEYWWNRMSASAIATKNAVVMALSGDFSGARAVLENTGKAVNAVTTATEIQIQMLEAQMKARDNLIMGLAKTPTDLGGDDKDKGKGKAPAADPPPSKFALLDLKELNTATTNREKSFADMLALGRKFYADDGQIQGKSIDAQAQELDRQYRSGIISAKTYYSGLKSLEDQHYQALQQALKNELALAGTDEKARADLLQKLAVLEVQHNAQIQKLDDQATQARLQNVRRIASLVTQMGTTILTQAHGWAQALQQLKTAVVSFIEQMIEQWAEGAIMAELASKKQNTAEGAKTSASLTTAAAETWSAYAGIPFVGPALAAAQIALMYTSMPGTAAASEGVGAGVATARRVGGLVEGPELTLLGEDGPEVVAPKSDFLDFTQGIFALGNLNANMARRQGQVESLNRTAASYANARPRAGASGSAGGGPVFNITQKFGHVMDTSQRGQRQFGRLSMDSIMVAARERGVVLQPGSVFGRNS